MPQVPEQPDTDLPEGWVSATVRDVVERPQPGFACGRKDVPGGVAHLRMNNVGIDCRLDFSLVRTVPKNIADPKYDLLKGDVLVCTTNSAKLVGKCALFDEDGRFAFSNHLTRLRPIPCLVDRQFLAWSIWAAWLSGAFADKCQNWVNQSTLPKEALLDTQFFLPPLPEQQRIVAKVEELLARVNAAREKLATVPAILKRFRQAVLAAACSGRLTEEWMAGADSVTWQDFTFGDVIASSFYGPRYNADDYSDVGVPTIRTTDMDHRGAIDLSNSPRIRLSAEQLAKLGLQDGDLLVTRTGATIGKCALYTESLGPALPSAYLIRFRLKKALIEPRYALFSLLSPQGQSLLLGGTTAVAQPNVNAKAIAAFNLAVPPLPEQHEIVRRVEQLFALADSIEKQAAAGTTRVEKLTQSILAKAFRGELVPTEAELARIEGREYETAAALLARIKAGKAENVQRRTLSPLQKSDLPAKPCLCRELCRKLCRNLNTKCVSTKLATKLTTKFLIS